MDNTQSAAGSALVALRAEQSRTARAHYEAGVITADELAEVDRKMERALDALQGTLEAAGGLRPQAGGWSIAHQGTEWGAWRDGEVPDGWEVWETGLTWENAHDLLRPVWREETPPQVGATYAYPLSPQERADRYLRLHRWAWRRYRVGEGGKVPYRAGGKLLPYGRVEDLAWRRYITGEARKG